MLNYLIWTAIIVLGAAGILLVYAATRPDDFRISRSVNIKAPPEKIFPLINDLRVFNSWNPFAKQDPLIQLTYSGADSGAGAQNAWVGKKAGKGWLEITGGTGPSIINMALHMEKPIKADNDIVFQLQPKDGSTDVSWTMSGTQPYIGKVLSTIISMDKMCGRPFEQGLADLKAIAEKNESV